MLGHTFPLLEGATGVPWGSRRVFPVPSRGTGLYGAALLLSAVAGFVVAPVAEPYLWRLASAAGAWLMGPVPELAGVAVRPEAASAAEYRGLRATQEVRVAELRSWTRWLVAQATQVVWPASGEGGWGQVERRGQGGEWNQAGEWSQTVPTTAPAPSGRKPEPPEPIPAPGAPPGPSRVTLRQPLRSVWVAVYHTHASEMYRADSFAPEDPQAYHRFGTTDTGILRVGATLVRALNEYGIPAIHLTTLHDTPDFRSAYARSLETARTLVERYPSLRLLIDLHRDAPQEGGALITSVDGEEAAKIAIVVGTGDGGKEGASNLAAARLLADELDARFPGLLRRIIVQPGRRYNQHVHPGALLIEIGSYRSREEAALRSARLLAQAIAAMLLRSPFPQRVWG